MAQPQGYGYPPPVENSAPPNQYGGYAPPQQGYPPPQAGYPPPQQPGYAPTQPGYAPPINQQPGKCRFLTGFFCPIVFFLRLTNRKILENFAF